ncbi:MAG: ATP synthase F1 subunit epsilon [Bryobacteraceae bacterium]|jgi:F-type H+-transporting ATPase subunit epsilon
MADTFQLQVATPERLFVDEQVSEAELPGRNGYMGILPGHAPLLSALAPGILTYGSGGNRQAIVIDGGFVEIFEDHVRVLADSAERPDQIDINRARQDLDAANRALREAHDSQESDAALELMQKAQARIDITERGSGLAH